MKETLTALGVGGGGDGGEVAAVLIQEISTSESYLRSIVQVTKQGTLSAHEFIGDLSIKEEGIVVHRRGLIATIKDKLRAERKAPTALEFIEDAQFGQIVENVLRRLGCIAVGVAVPGEGVGGPQLPRVNIIVQTQPLSKMRATLPVVGQARSLIH